jgi:peptidoglycan glycosyltransferase
MKNKRLNGIFILYFLLAAVVVYFLADRMLIRRDEFQTSRFQDKKFIGLMNELIEKGIFEVRDEQALVDEQKLRLRELGKRTEQRVRDYIPYLYVKDGRIYFEDRSASIANIRQNANEFLIRGRFLDRNGVVLAKSEIDAKTKNVKREYLFGPVFYPVIGHDHVVYGKRNLEKVLDAYLSGVIHAPVYQRTDDSVKKTRLGDDVVLTIDSSIQKAAFDAMAGKKGAVVVLDVKTGEILAAVSAPAFDPAAKEAEVWRKVFRDNKERLYENRAFSALYPPGSTFKVVVASAWIERIKANGEEKNLKLLCDGKKNKYQISDIHAHGMVDFERAFAESCNVYFSEIGVRLGEEIMNYSKLFGFGKPVNLLPGLPDLAYEAIKSDAFTQTEERAYAQPDTASAKSLHQAAFDFRHNPKLVAQGAIGQNLVQATPLQMAMVAATVANGGIALAPSILKELRKGGGKALFSAGKGESHRVIEKETSEKIRKLMIMVMTKGTGKGVRKLYYDGRRYTTKPVGAEAKAVTVAGKTGTAEVGDKNGNGHIDQDEKPHSWFIGFAPADQPQFAIAVAAENQGFGSLTAAPIAVDVLAEALNNLQPVSK